MSVSTLQLLQRASASLQRVAADKGPARMTERDFQRAVEAASGARSGALELASWPNVGRVDLELPGRLGLELKWCRSGNTLANCVWDVAKLATALAEGRLDEGVIVAGAPVAHWRGAASGVELFDDAVHSSEGLVKRYESWWRFWCNDVLTRPVRLPATIGVSALGRLEVDLAGTAYELRAARVDSVDRVWRDHVCPHRWRGERCGPRPWDPEGWGGSPSQESTPG